MVELKLYTKPNCVQCNASKRELAKDKYKDVFKVVTIDISEDEDARTYVMNELGHLQAPVLEVDGAHWSGHSPDKIQAAADKALSQA